MHSCFWREISLTRFAINQEVSQKSQKFQKQEEYLQRQREFLDKGKLSKKKIRKLEEKNKIHEVQQYKLQRLEEKKKLLKIVEKNQAQGSDVNLTKKY